MSQQAFQVPIISVATGEILSRHKFCHLFLLMLQHKLFCHSSLPVLLFNFLSRQNFCSFPIVSVAIGAFMSRLIPPGFNIQHKKPCRNIISLCLSSLVTFFSCSIATHCHFSRHSFSSILSPLCYDRRNTIVTFFLSHSLGRLSRHTKLMS